MLAAGVGVALWSGTGAYPPPPDLNQVHECTLGMPCTLFLSGSGYPSSGSRRRVWLATNRYPPNYPMNDIAKYWVLVNKDTGAADPCAADVPYATFDCPGSQGPILPPQQWQNPRGNNGETPMGYELCPNGATAGLTTTPYVLCWATNEDGVADPPFTHIGTFIMKGPSASTAATVCVMGLPCKTTLTGNIDSFGSSAVLVVRGIDDSVCTARTLYDVERADFDDALRSNFDFNNPGSSVSWSGTHREYSLGIATKANKNDPNLELGSNDNFAGMYRICWAVVPGAFDSTSADYDLMRKGVDVGAFVLYGPKVARKFVCVLTLSCSMEIQGKFYAGMAWALILSQEDTCGASSLTRAGVANSASGGDWVNPISGTTGSTSRYTVSFGAPTVGTTREYYLCWGMGAATDADYAVRVGTATMAGPVSCEAPCACHKGDDCTVFLEVIGLTEALSRRNRIQILEPGNECGSLSPPKANLSPEGAEKLVNGGSTREYSVGKVKDGIAKPDYVLCWGAGANTSIDPYDYVVGDLPCYFKLGTFQMLGANYRDMECTLGLPCQFQLVGVSLAAANRVIILDNSADTTECFIGALARFNTLGTVPTDGDGNPAYAALQASSASPHDTYSMGTPDGVPENLDFGRYLVCWANAAASYDASLFTVPVGKLTIVGPSKTSMECTLSLPCTITLQGVRLASTNRVLLIPAKDECGQPPLPRLAFVGMENPHLVDGTTGTEETFHLGTPGSAPLEPGPNYKACWGHDPDPADEASFRVYVGIFTLTGSFTFSDPPCGGFTPGEDPYCIMGELCSMGTRPQQLTIDPDTAAAASTNEIFIAAKTPACCAGSLVPVRFQTVQPSALPTSQAAMPNPVSGDPAKVNPYDLGRPTLERPFGVSSATGSVAGIPGDYLLCWAHDPNTPSDFNTAVGTLQFRGPFPQSAQCIMGEFCRFTLSGSFKNFAVENILDYSASRVLIRHASQSCGDNGVSLTALWVGMTNPSPRPRAADVAEAAISYEFATGINNQPSTSYQLCWAYNPPNGVPGATSIYSEYRVSVGSFTMNGPEQGQKLICQLGAGCNLAIQGIGLAVTNQVLVLSKYGAACGSYDPNDPMVLAAMPGLLNPRQVTNDADANKYDLGVVSRGGSYSECRVSRPRESCIGFHYKLCWAHGVGRTAQGELPFVVDVGTFGLAGVYGSYSVECVLGQLCAFSLSGLQLSVTNQVIVIEDFGTCGDADPALAKFEGLQMPKRATSASDDVTADDGTMQVTFHLGVATSGRFGSYKLCWGSNPVSFSHFRAEVGPFHFREASDGGSCSVWDNHCFQKVE